jgi:RNA polymerase sigma-70 factor (ECF subfamily)
LINSALADSSPTFGNPRAWLYKIATNTAFSRLKRERLVLEKTALFTTEHADQPHLSDEVETRSLLADVYRAGELLPHNQRLALLMWKYRRLSYQEISPALDCSPDSARAKVYQGLQKLRRQFQPTAKNEVIQ